MEQRQNEDQRTLGKLFFLLVDEMADITFNRYLAIMVIFIRTTFILTGTLRFFHITTGYRMILSILVYTFFSRMFDLMLPPVAKHSIVVA
jgi:hypothetical protein